MEKETSKLKNFLSVLKNNVTPKPKFAEFNPLYAFLVIPVYICYKMGENAYQAMNTNYITSEEMEVFFLESYNQTENVENFSKKLRDFSYSGNESMYMFMLKYLSRRPENLEKSQKFMTAIITDAKVKPDNFSKFFENVLAFMCIKNHTADMKYILNNQDIKNHIINNNLFYDINKEQLIEHVKFRNPNYPHPGLDYLIDLPEEILKFNIEQIKYKKLKM